MSVPAPTALDFEVTPETGRVSALLEQPSDAHALLVLAHGAGAGMRHAFMEALTGRLAERGVATLRYQFPYIEGERRRGPNPRRILLATVRAALAKASGVLGDLPLFAGGKSMGGRMTSLAESEEAWPGLRGIVFVGFPLHPAGRPGTERGEHLASVKVPMLFLQGTRDKLAEPELLAPVCAGLGARAELRRIEGADHSFHVLKRSGRTDPEVLGELADYVAAFTSAR